MTSHNAVGEVLAPRTAEKPQQRSLQVLMDAIAMDTERGGEINIKTTVSNASGDFCREMLQQVERVLSMLSRSERVLLQLKASLL